MQILVCTDTTVGIGSSACTLQQLKFYREKTNKMKIGLLLQGMELELKMQAYEKQWCVTVYHTYQHIYIMIHWLTDCGPLISLTQI